MNTQPYSGEVTLEQIILDGWQRGFEPTQTVDEARQMGFNCTTEDVLSEWKILDKAFEEDFPVVATSDGASAGTVDEIFNNPNVKFLPSN